MSAAVLSRDFTDAMSLGFGDVDIPGRVHGQRLDSSTAAGHRRESPARVHFHYSILKSNVQVAAGIHRHVVDAEPEAGCRHAFVEIAAAGPTAGDRRDRAAGTYLPKRRHNV